MARRTRVTWPLARSAPDAGTPAETGSSGDPFFNQFFRHCVGPGRDPTLTWGTDVDMTGAQAFVREASQRWNVPVTMPPLLVKAVGAALRDHPRFLQRIVRRRRYSFQRINVILAYQNAARREADLQMIFNVDTEPLPDLVRRILRDAMRSARGEDLLAHDRRMLRWAGPLKGLLMRTGRALSNNLNMPDVFGRMVRMQTAVAMVNYLNFAGAPPLRSFKAALPGVNSVSVHVALGPAEQRPTVANGEVVVRSLAPLIVRTDHRIADAIELGRLAGTVRGYLADPWRIPKLEAAEETS
jgi:pyruvate/2-oxoglutarate dehydrogenase complex dihydrolipoamide acyltransferase (E2) component